MTTQNNTPGKKLRVLMQNRSTTFTHRGGDTIVIERLAQGLQDRGVDVTVDLQGAANPKDYDLVHLYNFALPDMVKIFAERCVQAGTPYVVTTLCEDVPRFHTQSHAVANTLIEYVARGQDRTWLDSNWPDLSTVKGVPAFNNEWSARNAAALFPNGKEEAAAILRNHPGLANLVNIPLGHEIGSTEGAEMFVREYGVQDFILCVGRLESRKNQLMLLAALEESDLPVVLAAGGFSYQPDFEASVKNFKRRGKTLILDRLSPEMLASAYAAARVHVLPSWYELPGLVSLEAASRGKNVVVTRYGTASDYFGDKAFYCNPAELDSIYTAVMSAYYSPLKSGLRETASKYTWDNAVAETLQAYQQVLSISKQSAATITTTAATTTVEARTTGASPVYDMTSTATDFQEQVEKGEMAARNGNYKDAHRYLSMAENLDPQSVRVLKARGAVFLAESKVPEAKAYFDRALIFSPEDSKVLCGRGMCEVKVGNEAGALPYFSKAVTASPDSATAIRQLTQAAMAAKQFGEAERAVKSYLALKPEDTGMRVMFSEALMTTGRTDDAREQVMAALRLEPENEIARTLMTKLSAETPQTTKTTVAQPSSMQTTPQPQQETPPKGLGPLAELSKMISGWKVPVATAETTATTTPTASDTTNKTEEKPRDETATLEATRTTSETEASKPWRGTVRQDNSVAIDTFFIEAEEAKREKRFEDVLKKCKTILGYPGITPMQKARAESLQAEILVVEGRLDEAAAEYERILTEVPGCTRALCGKGALEAHSGNWSGAAKCFDEALKGRQDVDIALSGLAMCAQQEGRIEDAWKLFMQALQVNQENYRAILGVIQLGYKLSRLNEIESVLRTFLEIHPANIEMLYSLAGVLFAQRRMMEANAQLDTILLFESEHKLALELKRVIEDAEKDQVTVVGQ